MNSKPNFFQRHIYSSLVCADWIFKCAHRGKERSKGQFSENYLVNVYYNIIQKEIRERNSKRNDLGLQGDSFKQQAKNLLNEKN